MLRARSILLARCRNQKFGSGVVATGCESKTVLGLGRGPQSQAAGARPCRHRRGRSLGRDLPRFFLLPLMLMALALVGSLSVSVALAESADAPGARAIPASLAVGGKTEEAIRKLPAVSDAVHLDDGGAHATLSFDLSHPVDASAFVLTQPDRVVVDLPEVAFRIDPEAGNAAPVHRRGRRARLHTTSFS